MTHAQIEQAVRRGAASKNATLPDGKVARIVERLATRFADASRPVKEPAAYAYLAGKHAAIDAWWSERYRERLAAEAEARQQADKAARERRLTGVRQCHAAVSRLIESGTPRVTPPIAAGLDALLKSAITGIPGDVLAREQGITRDNLYQRVLRAKRLVEPLVGEEGLELLRSWKR